MLVTSRCDFYEALAFLLEYKATGFVVDTETTGLEMFAKSNPARLCSIQLAPIDAPSKGFYFPYRHDEGFNLPLETLDALRQVLKGAVLLAHNVAFDVKILMCDGFSLPPTVLDSRIASQLANENEKTTKQGKPFALKKLCAQYFGTETISAVIALKAELKRRKLSVAKEGIGNLWRLPASVVYQYGIDDLLLCHRLHENRVGVLRQWRLEKAYASKCKAQLVAIKMERRGLLLDQPELRRQRSLLGPRLEELKRELEDASGGINIKSPEQVKKWLGLPRADKKLLQAVIDANPANANPNIRKLLEYREAFKAESTYFIPFQEKTDANGRLHTSFNIGGARTGRWSSSGPNMQNCSKDRQSYSLKRCIHAAPGYFLFEADYSSLEPRVGAYFTRDQGAIEVFQNGLDYYRPIAAKMFKMSEADITKELRDSSKSTALGVGYGMGAWKLAVTQGLKHPRLQNGSYEWHSDHVWHMSKEGDLKEVACSEVDPVYCSCEGRKLVQWFFSAVPSMQPTIKAVTSTMQRNKYIRFPLSGRIRRLEEYWNADSKRIENNAHKSWNALLQGTGADIVEAALVALDAEVSEEEARMLVAVHDSALFEIKQGPRAVEVCNKILALMETTTCINPVPLVVEAKYGTSWGDMTKYARTL